MVPDYYQACLVTLVDATDAETAEILCRKQQLQSMMRRFLSGKATNHSEADLYNLQRAAMSWWERCVDHALRVSIGAGLEICATANTPFGEAVNYSIGGSTGKKTLRIILCASYDHNAGPEHILT